MVLAIEYLNRKPSERSYRLGGSSWGDLFEAHPWGCRRRLWYDIHGQSPDKEWREPPSMRRGKDLEPVVLEKFRSAYEESNPAHFVISFEEYSSNGGVMLDDMPEYLHPHPDGVITDDLNNPRAAVECKAVGAQSARAMIAEQEPPLSYRMQLHTYMYALGVRLGHVAVLDTWNWEFNSYLVEFDDELWYNMISKADAELDELFFGELPELFWMDHRCKGCKYLGSCQAHERRKGE